MTESVTLDQFKRYTDRLRNLVDKTLPHLVVDKAPEGLYRSVRYILEGGGKRFRPLLCLLAAEMFGVDNEIALPGALAVEVFHNFTLVHDDVMDNADERRGRPTVHVKWDESTAILCGDYLLSLSYDLLARLETGQLRSILETYNRMVVHLCEGQALDTEFEQRQHVSIDEYIDMIDGKTGALLIASLEIGGLLGDADRAAMGTLREMGGHLGRAFQIQDDLLDITAKDKRWGKVIGGDLMEGKKTYLLLRAIERTSGERRLWFERIIKGDGIGKDEVSEARERMIDSGVIGEADNVIKEYSARAETCLTRLPQGAAVDTLQWLIRRMALRMY